MNAPHVFQAQAENADLAFHLTVSYRGTHYSPDIHDEIITRLVRAYRELIAVHEKPDTDLGLDVNLQPMIDSSTITVDIQFDDDDNDPPMEGVPV